ncbi:phage neck terminator protein [Psychrobacillus lasiicapitis]|uniref:Phage neck terminator protein gp12-like domain-containing protein n=1 Tax=Psychrobacillus lasiicapitis TaxID=1636719 RepID=A0A544TAQ3_9BACI|nr:hypothetical protein [Psychrobacillus lasiicapitis]TQR14466.1 hypothetical protein FG382_08400 [Psychrobacillus lasiicapitis]GGA31091.1 hypothetical protein GCM10011384_20740 [Psychrobacillus lasiicapitis]
MIEYDDWWIPVQKGLSTYISKNVIQAETTGKQPPYPFVTIKQTTQAIGIGFSAVFTGDGTQTIHQDYEMVLSLTVHSESIEETTNLANKARNYFLGKGTIELSDAYIAIVDVLPATNRDVFLNIEYERRVGFDVRLRVRDIETYNIDVIEKVTVSSKEEE